MDFLDTLWERANSRSEKSQSGWRQDFEDEKTGAKEHAYGAWVFSKNNQPRAKTWKAQLIAYSCDDGPIFEDTSRNLHADLGIIEKSVDIVLNKPEKELINVFGMVTHPGHHAGPAYLSGYCYMNNISIAAKLLRNAGKRVGIVDIDYHGGNGTYDMVLEKRLDDTVKFVSLHVDGGYPYVEMDKYGRNLSRKTNWKTYSKKLKDVLDSWSDLDVILVSLGWDTYYDDPLGGFDENGLFDNDYYFMGKMFHDMNKDILFLQEGGYAIDNLPTLSQKF
eukprot:UN24495